MQHDFSKVSQPNSQGRWFRTLGVSAIAALGCFSTAASAIETDFGVEYRAVGFYVQSDSFETPENGLDPETDADDNDNGFAHFLRLSADFKHEDSGVAVITRIELAGDRWVGDERGYKVAGDQAFNSGNSGDNVRLDLGYIQFPLGKTLVRVGRQESNWSNCFLVCDDRRDRILAIRRFGSVTGILGYDRRKDTATFYNEDNGDQIFGAFVAPIGSWQLGFLYVHYLNSYKGNLIDTNPVLVDTDADGIPDAAAAGSTGVRNVYVISNANLLSPYVMGSVGPIDIEAGVNYFWGGNVEANQTPQDGDYFTEESISEYFRIGAEMGMVEVKAQYVGAQDGGIISTGFDTYSSLINSSPESTANPTSVYQMGRHLGREGFDESLIIANLTVNVTPQFALSASVGSLNVDVPDGPAPGDQSGSDSSMVYDVQASYQINEALRTWATFGILEENDVGVLRGNSLIGALPNGGSFEEDGVMAGSINIGVEF